MHEFTEPIMGAVHYDTDLQRYFIRYRVPGTIDSSLVGWICDIPEVDFELEKVPIEGTGLPVEFTGNFRDIEDFSPLTTTAGSEHFFLELLSLDLVRNDTED